MENKQNGNSNNKNETVNENCAQSAPDGTDIIIIISVFSECDLSRFGSVVNGYFYLLTNYLSLYIRWCHVDTGIFTFILRKFSISLHTDNGQRTYSVSIDHWPVCDGLFADSQSVIIIISSAVENWIVKRVIDNIII